MSAIPQTTIFLTLRNVGQQFPTSISNSKVVFVDNAKKDRSPSDLSKLRQATGRFIYKGMGGGGVGVGFKSEQLERGELLIKMHSGVLRIHNLQYAYGKIDNDGIGNDELLIHNAEIKTPNYTLFGITKIRSKR